jgi:cytochrome P450
MYIWNASKIRSLFCLQTAATLTFACYALAMYPACHTKLRAEVLETFGTSGYPTFEALRGMKYLRAFINEVLR